MGAGVKSRVTWAGGHLVLDESSIELRVSASFQPLRFLGRSRIGGRYLRHAAAGYELEVSWRHCGVRCAHGDSGRLE